MVTVEDMSDLLRGPAQALSQLRLIEPGLAHRAVEFELGGCQSGQSHYRTAMCRRRSRDVLAMSDHTEDRFLEHVLRLKQRLVQRVALRRPVSDIRKSDDVPAVLLGVELHRVDVTEEFLGQRRSSYFVLRHSSRLHIGSTQILRPKPEISQDVVERAGANLSAAGRRNRCAAVQLDPDVAALASLCNNRSAETAKPTKKLTARHA